MKKTFVKRGMALCLSALMLFSTATQSVFAYDDDVSVEAVEATVDEEASKEDELAISVSEVTADSDTESADDTLQSSSVSDDAAATETDDETTVTDETATEVQENTSSETSEDTKDTSKEESKSEQEEASEKTERFSKIADDSILTDEALNGYDFSSCRLIVAGATIVDPENEISSYDGVSLLQYKDAKTTKYAYSYYYGKAAYVDIDSTVSVAAGESETASTSPMSESDNPLTELAQTPFVSGGSNVIALIDTGVNGVSNVISSVSMIGDSTSDDNGHGTKMAEAIVSVNPDAQIISIKALGTDGTGDVSAIYAAIEYAKECGAGIINLSISGVKKADDSAIAAAISDAVSAGIKVVAAAGNNGSDASFFIPGGLSGVITIGAATESGEKRSSSNYGSCVNYNVVADSTSEAAAKYSAYLALGKSGVDDELVFDTGAKAEESEWLQLSDEEVDALTGVTHTEDLKVADSQYAVASNGTFSFYGATAPRLASGSQTVYCVLPWSKVPTNDTYTFTDYGPLQLASNDKLQLMARIIYYGYNGGGNHLSGYSADEQNAITHFALSYVWVNLMGNSYEAGLNSWTSSGNGTLTEDGKAIVMQYVNWCRSADAVTGNLHIAALYADKGHSHQDIVLGDFTKVPTDGYLRAQKASASSVASSNCYTYSGVQFKVYTNAACTAEAKDTAGNAITLQTGANGYTDTVRVAEGTYYVREVQSTVPSCWYYNSTPTKVTVTTGNTATTPATATVNNTPKMDPIGILLKKVDAKTGNDVRHVG